MIARKVIMRENACICWATYMMHGAFAVFFGMILERLLILTARRVKTSMFKEI